ncbi:MAG TPA: universal stress protein [Thermoplasmata archaeon]|nr:universal stress protein [Thermoplasmata archaeon]
MDGGPAKAAPTGEPLIRRALVALSARGPSVEAYRSALARLRALEGELLLVHVELRPTSAPGNEADGAPADEAETEIMRAIRTAAVAELGERGHAVPIKILHGDVGQRICEYAEFARCDGIVLGPRERASLAKALRGSVTRYVLAHSRASVLILGEPVR